MNFLHSRWKMSVAAGVLSAVVTAGVLYLNVQRTHAALVQLRQANEEQSLKLLQRSAPAETPRAAAAPASPPAATVAVTSAPPVPMPALYRNQGQATPVATLQTFAWACDEGDVAALAKLITFDGDSRARAAAYLAQLPESQRAKWASPEELAATVCIAGYLRWPYPAADIIDLATLETISADRVRLRLPGTTLDGGNYQKTADGWKFVIPSDQNLAERLRILTPADPAPSK